MSVHKRKEYRSGTIWYYAFDAPGSTRQNRRRVKESGFATKQEAIDAEAARRTEEQKKYEMAKAGVGITAEVPKTLAMLLEEFFRQHADEKLAPKTIERYHEQAACLGPELLAMPLAEITPLQLSGEWTRLLRSGGHHRRTKKARPLSAKTVRNIAGVLSSAFSRAIRWGLVTMNPVTNSEPPVPRKRINMALLPSEQSVLIESATGPLGLPMFLDMSAATGARRGEVLALRWSDVQNGYATIERLLSQTNQGLEFKGTKTERPRRVELPPSALARLENHRKRQDELRRQFGPDYRADLDLIFANPDGTPLKPDSISATVSILCRRLGLPKGASLHTLRHSHASVLLANGVDLATVSARLGHSSVRVTADIYSHALRGRDREAACRWDELMGRTASEGQPKPVN
ncbi:MAG: site-specific integrase [Acidobacteriia bacterium]|nr:site-specific integrase [Terriglobia bacterium]